MKIRVVVTVDVDTDAWAAEYGMDKDDVRDDVKAYVTALVNDSFPVESGLIKDVTTK